MCITNEKCTDTLDLKDKCNQQFPSSLDIKFMLLNPWSINSLSKFNDFKEVISYLDLQFDLIVVPESWILESQKDLYIIGGYSALHSCRGEEGKGGVTLFYRSTHQPIEFEIISEPTYNIIRAKFNIRNTRLTVFAVYRTPPLIKREVTPFLDRLESLFEKHIGDKCIMLGDLNFHPSQSGSLMKLYMELLVSYDMKLCNTHPTREASQTLLDHVCLNFYHKKPLTILTCPLTDNDSLKTDHSIVVTVINACGFQPINEVKFVTRLDHCEIEKQLEWRLHTNILKYMENSNRMASYIVETIHDVSNKYKRMIRITSKKEEACEWMNFRLKSLIKNRDNLRRKMKRKTTPQREAKLRSLSNQISHTKLKSKGSYYTNLFSDNSDSRSTWKNINKILGRNNRKCAKEITLNAETGLISDKKEVANEFNRYFTSVGSNMANRIPQHSHDHINQYNTLFFNHSYIEDQFTNPREVLTVINKMKPRKAPGADRISIDFIKKHKQVMSTAISHLFNVSFKNAKYPDPLKIAKTIALFKGGDKEEISNYRPISLLSTLSKILEKLLYTRILSFMTEQGILSSNQYGFRPSSSTQTAATEMVEKIEMWIDEGKCAAAVFIDISKAFDTVKHSILLNKLHMYGIRGRTYYLLADYLANRKQYTSNGDEDSDELPLSWGVIQGGVLAALLFIIYINDMCHLKLKGRLYSYADDTCIIYEQYNRREIEHDMQMISDYLRINFLSMNTSKTKYMVLKSVRTSTVNEDILLNNVCIEKVSDANYLGLHIDESLSWTCHIDDLRKQISKYVGILSKLRFKLPTHALKQIYHSMIHNKLSYMTNAWGLACDTSLKRLFILQKRALKHVFKVPLLHSTSTLFETTAEGILPLRSVHFKSMVIHVHQCMYNLTHNNSNFLHNNHTRNTRSSRQNRLKVPTVRTTKYGLQSVRYNAVKFYNLLPTNVKTISNILNFKKKVTHWIRENHLQYY